MVVSMPAVSIWAPFALQWCTMSMSEQWTPATMSFFLQAVMTASIIVAISGLSR